jgi:NAD(P)-dependent dehydrogenase (short-subunit alcohol dehydrogenase family)
LTTQEQAIPVAPRLAGRVALITGASRGFGRAIALRFAREGADVVVGYRSARESAQSVIDEIAAVGRHAVAIGADVGDSAQLARLVNGAHEAFGRVDVLVNNAGVMDVAPFASQSATQWKSMTATNIDGMLELTHRVLPGMVHRKWGRVICLASQLGHVGGENLAVYSGTKGFVLAFVKSLAREVGKAGITVNAICPGSIITDMNRHIFPPDKEAARVATLPLGRMGDPDDIGAAAAYLASEDAAFMTGQCLDVNGGATMA